jgi:SOS response regulatory protein OraA/RecX
MSAEDPRHQELIGWLREQGHNPDEIEKILAKVAEYDAQTFHESVFDSISRGHFDLSAIIKEALDIQETLGDDEP